MPSKFLMIIEGDVVVLTREFPEHTLKEGDVGAVVHRHQDGALEVEFVTAEGNTIAVLTLGETDIRPFAGSEILHARAVPSVPSA